MPLTTPRRISVLGLGLLLLAANGVLALTIESPLEGDLFAPGDTIVVLLEDTENVANAVVAIPDAALVAALDEEAPFALAFAAPNVLGYVTLVVIAEDTNGEVESASVEVKIARTSVIEQLYVTPPTIEATHGGDVVRLTVRGRFSDGSETDLTRAASGTTYSTASGNTSLVSVSKDGVVIVQAGEPDEPIDAIEVRNADHTVLIPITAHPGFSSIVLDMAEEITVVAGTPATLSARASIVHGQVLPNYRFGLLDAPAFVVLDPSPDQGEAQLLIAPASDDVGEYRLQLFATVQSAVRREDDFQEIRSGDIRELRIVVDPPQQPPTGTPTPSSATSTPTASPASSASPTSEATPRPHLDPELARSAIKCQAAVAKAGAKFAGDKLKRLAKCVDGITKCIQTKEAPETRERCIANAGKRCTKHLSTVQTKDAPKLLHSVVTKCAADTLELDVLRSPDGLGYASLEDRCGVLTSIADVAQCVLTQHDCLVGRMFDFASPRARELIEFAGASLGSMTCLVHRGGAVEDVDDEKEAGKAIARCVKTTQQASRKFAAKKLSGLQKCVQELFACEVQDPSDPSCLQRARRKCTRQFGKIATTEEAIGISVRKNLRRDRLRPDRGQHRCERCEARGHLRRLRHGRELSCRIRRMPLPTAHVLSRTATVVRGTPRGRSPESSRPTAPTWRWALFMTYRRTLARHPTNSCAIAHRHWERIRVRASQAATLGNARQAEWAWRTACRRRVLDLATRLPDAAISTRAAFAEEDQATAAIDRIVDLVSARANAMRETLRR